MNIASKTKNDKFQENLSRPGIIDARARYRRLRNTALKNRTTLLTLLGKEA